LGYASSRTWLKNDLGIVYVSDDAGTTTAGGHTFGTAYEEDYPDVLSSQETIWTYSSGGGAAVGYNHQVIGVGFGLETIADPDLPSALAELLSWLGE
ncbi:MAG: hypothetical protein KC561_19375, partial [Myxococcales bacterium]|nr:hypothetical protein [Myxococcales bacterium]